MVEPAKLHEIRQLFLEQQDPGTRADLLLEFAGRFVEVPPRLATRPFPKERLVPGCESEVYVFEEHNAGSLRIYFAVENPQGLSAKGLAAILTEGLEGATIKEMSEVQPELVYDIFGKSLSMGKGKGLMGMVNVVKALATTALNQRK